MDLKLIENNSEYWLFIKSLRYHPENISGFVNTEIPSDQKQSSYMSNYGDCYFICLDGDNPVGFIGDVNNDIRFAVSPEHKGKGIGKFMLNEYANINPHASAKVLHNKMPYIWRFLKPKTRKHMIDLANKKVKDINIPFHVFPDKSSLYSLDKKTRKHMKNLREKYKDI